MSAPLAVGSQAPDFSLSATTGDTVLLSHYRGKRNLILVFYVGDNTQGDRTILTRLLILSHSAFSAASTKTPHERRRAQVRTLGPGRVSTPARWGR